MDRLEAMSLLVAAVDAGSLSAAARKLKMPLATVSRKIADLEARVNARMLIRTTRKLSLTEAGVAYVAAARRILEQVNEAERTAAGEFSSPRGELAIAAPIVFGRLHVLPVITDFLAAFPEINVRLSLSDRNVDLVDQHIDVAVRIGPLADSSLVATSVGSVRRVTCASPAYLARTGVPNAPSDLSRMTCVTFDALASTPPAWNFAAPGTGKDIIAPIHSRLSVNTAEAVIDAVTAGAGVTRVLSYQVAQAVRAGRIALVLREFEQAPLPVHLLHVAERALPLKTRSFVDFTAPRLRKALAAAAI